MTVLHSIAPLVATNSVIAEPDELETKIACIQADLLDEYQAEHCDPWIVGFSGGKDSTVVTHLVLDMLLALPPSERTRPIHVVSNDTLVESPLVMGHISRVQDEIRSAADAWRLPIKVVTTTPDPSATFWVNMIGRGYPSPNRSFRWCTDRMKILPTSRYIKDQVASSGEVILLLGVRRDESATRAGTIARYDNGERLHRHNDLAGCMVYRPIVDLTTDEVWEFLATNSPPWGGSHTSLIKLYRDAGGGECPVVTSKSDAPSCGSTSSRFGCWTCTVVEKDRSLEGFVEAGFSEFEPLILFRDWLFQIRNEPSRRMARRRDGRVTVTDEGIFVPGPFTLATRIEILERLQALQQRVGRQLITPDEVDRIRQIWADDAAASAMHHVNEMRDHG